MSASATDPVWDADDLPRVIPIFPLTGALLLPRSVMPLNIFEPRYLAMVRGALDGDGIIGMVQPLDPEDQRFEPPVYPVGCAGRIVEHKDLPDGRILISLEGVCRFEIREELARTTPYRQVVAGYTRFADDCRTVENLRAPERQNLLRDLEQYLERRGLSADTEALCRAPDELLVNALAMICPFEASEKQALLEAPTLSERTRTMRMLMTFAMASSDDGGGAAH